MTTATRLMERLISRGLALWIEGSEICFSPAELLTAEDLETLREHRELVLEVLPDRLPDQGAEHLCPIERAALQRAPEQIDVETLSPADQETFSCLALAYLRQGVRPELACSLAFAFLHDAIH